MPEQLSEAPTGYLEEAPGVKSSVRLFGAWLLGLATVVVCATAWYVVHAEKPDAGVIGALAGMVTALVLQGAVAIVNRR